jgi:hypothetical protein
MEPRRIIKALLYPHAAVMAALLPISAALLVLCMVYLGTESVFSVMSYVLSFYTLSVYCLRIPGIVRAIRRFKRENKLYRRWAEDESLRVRVTLYGALVWNTAYAVLQGGLGIVHRSFWYYSLAGYYILLAAMRFFLLRHTRRHRAGERMDAELKEYRLCGWLFLTMNLTLSVMVFFMIYWNRSFDHDEIVTIAMAAYTFCTLTVAIINTVKYRRYNSPVYSAAKAIGLASASVSVITLEATMLSTFGDGTVDESVRRLLLALTGGAVSVLLVVMAVYMIVQGTAKLKALHGENRDNERE